MHILYLIALLPIFIGFILWIFDRKITWWEWACGSALAFIVAGVVHIVAIDSILDDTQTLSGQITYGVRIPTWEEYYEYAVYRTEYTTDSKGHVHSHEVFDHWQPSERHHSESNAFYSNIDTEYNVSHGDFDVLAIKFGKNSISASRGCRETSSHNSHMISGDPNDYRTDNHTKWIQPITKLVHWQNRIKAGPSVFSFEKVPEGIKVYDWPENPDPFNSNRLLGLTGNINSLYFDQINAVLGPTKKVNLIFVGFGNLSSNIAQYQEAKWIGGKKNDLVVCFGGANKDRADWCYVFGWTDRNIVKKNIESLILSNDLNNDLVLKVVQEVKANYIIKDWHEFDYMTVEPTTKVYVWFIVFLIITQIGFYWYANCNNIDKLDSDMKRTTSTIKFRYR